MPLSWRDVAWWSGLTLVVVDLANWLFWISIAAQYLDKGGDELPKTVDVLLALAAPHTTLVPSILAVLNDLVRHCGSGACSLETPNWQWYVFPALIIPFDALDLAYNMKAHPDDRPIVIAATWSLVMSSLACAWSVVTGTWVLRSHTRRRKALGEVKRDEDVPLVQGIGAVRL